MDRTEPATLGPWLTRFERPRLMREGPVFHRYSATDVDTGSPRLVVVGSPAAPALEVRRRLDEAARVLALLNHEHVPKVEARARVGEIEYLSLVCDARDDFAQLLQHLAAAGLKFPMAASSGLADRFISLLEAAHATVDPNHGSAVCLGRFSWANVLLSESGKPWFVGFGDDLLVSHPDFTGELIVAPEVMLGAHPSRGGDLWALLTLFRSLLALREVPPALERVLKGHPPPADEPLRRCLTAIHERILISPYVATGTTVTRDVPDDALAVGRARQSNKEGYASRLRARMEAAQKAADSKTRDRRE